MSFDLSFAAAAAPLASELATPYSWSHAPLAAASFAPLAGNWEHAELAAPFIGDATLAHAAPLAGSWTGAASWAHSSPLAAQAGLW